MYDELFFDNNIQKFYEHGCVLRGLIKMFESGGKV